MVMLDMHVPPLTRLRRRRRPVYHPLHRRTHCTRYTDCPLLFLKGMTAQFRHCSWTHQGTLSLRTGAVTG